MRIKKQYEVIVNLSAGESYTGDIDAVVMSKLRKYEGRCLSSSMVEKITRIVTRSMWMPDAELADGSGNINVIFEADAIIYHEGDIITNCTVNHIERTGDGRLGLICQTVHAAVHIRGNTSLRDVQTGQIIPIKVNTVRYSKGQKSITINATPYFQSMEFFLVKTNIDPSAARQEDVETLQILLEQQAEMKKKLDSAEPKLVKFFTDTFHPFKDDKIKTPAKFSEKSIIAESKRLVDSLGKESKAAENIVFSVRHPQHAREGVDFFHIEEGFFKGELPKIELLNPKSYQIKIVSASYTRILISYLQEHISYLNMIYEMTQLYDTEEKRKKHKNIWAIYDRLKR